MANVFESEISKSALMLGVYYEKMPIPTKLIFRGGKAALIKLKENPYDGFIVHDGRHIPLEMKSQAVYGSFPLSNIADHQIRGLRKMTELGCTTYLLINQRSVADGDRKISYNRAWALDFANWDSLLKQLCSRKSIPVELFESGDLLIEIPRIRVSFLGGKELSWDIRILTNETPHLYTSPEPWYSRISSCVSKSNLRKKHQSDDHQASGGSSDSSTKK